MNTVSNSLNELAPVLGAAAMRQADRVTIEEIGIPGFTLMESAGRETTRVAQEMIELLMDVYSQADSPATGHVICVCGKGNNGGDGFVIARYLASYGHRIEVLLMAPESDYTNDAAANLKILRKLAAIQKNLTVLPFSTTAALDKLETPDLLVDALLGTGLQSAVRAPYDAVIGWMNALMVPVLSVDVPSGISSDSGHMMGCAVAAAETVTMGALKPGLLLGDGPDYSGALHVVDIGIPAHVLQHIAASHDSPRISNSRYVAARLPEKSRKDHKYTSGPALIAGGSASFPGAPALAARGAARSGSGYVVCACPEEIRTILLEKLDDIPVESWPDNAQNGADAVQRLVTKLGARWTKAKSLLVGPGLGRAEGAPDLVKALLTSFNGPCVVDADALFALMGEQDWVRAHSGGQWVFTPHAGEFHRLMGPSSETDLLKMGIQFAKEWNVILLLKGQPSVTFSPDGHQVINTTGNPGAATAGSGDVLAGVVCSLLSQGLSPLDAAIGGIHLAGTAADLFVEERAAPSMVASDILELLPSAIAQLLPSE
jgi:NAD(P)H-hydrate epimerase